MKETLTRHQKEQKSIKRGVSPEKIYREISEMRDSQVKEDCKTLANKLIKRMLRVADDHAMQVLEQKAANHETWAVKILIEFVMKFHESHWLDRISVLDVNMKLETKDDYKRLIKDLTLKLLNSGKEIELAEIKEIVKMLNTINFTEEVRESMAGKFDDETIKKFNTVIKEFKVINSKS